GTWTPAATTTACGRTTCTCWRRCCSATRSNPPGNGARARPAGPLPPCRTTAAGFPTMKRLLVAASVVLALAPGAFLGGRAPAGPPGPPAVLPADAVRGLPLRSLGPALAPGRVGDIAVDPRDRKVWYVAVASGGLWKTTDAGKSWQPIFDHYGSYSLGCVTLDPNNPDVVWLGTGAHQAQRSVGFRGGGAKG